MPQPIAYLAFNGNCADAMRFYARALGGTLEVMLRTADSPMAAEVPPEFGDRIMGYPLKAGHRYTTMVSGL
jgi:PhnB protein